MYDKNALIELVREKALEFGDFVLASGKRASFYLDCRRVTLDPRGANLIGEGILELLGDDIPDVIGGMAIGADPITAAVVTLAGQRNVPLAGFIVRKEAKTHGTGRAVEGPVAAGQTAVVVEDTVTTGASSLRAVALAEAAGLKVQRIIAVVDRLEGGQETVASKGYTLQCLLTVRDLGINSADEPESHAGKPGT